MLSLPDLATAWRDVVAGRRTAWRYVMLPDASFAVRWWWQES